MVLGRVEALAERILADVANGGLTATSPRERALLRRLEGAAIALGLCAAESDSPVHTTNDRLLYSRPVKVVGYIRVSTEDQARSGAGLAAQRAAITAEAERRDWQLVETISDAGASGSRMDRRVGLQRALKRVTSGDADALVVAKLDRLSRSLLDFAVLMERSRREKWALIALDLGVDTSTPAGEVMASVLASFAQFERRLIGERTTVALAARRAAGQRLGRPSHLDPATEVVIRKLRAGGKSFASIADELNASGTPTGQGGRRWYASTVRAVSQRGTTHVSPGAARHV